MEQDNLQSMARLLDLQSFEIYMHSLLAMHGDASTQGQKSHNHVGAVDERLHWFCKKISQRRFRYASNLSDLVETSSRSDEHGVIYREE